MRDSWENLAFALTAFSVAAVALFELLAMRAQTPQLYGILVRYAHIPVATMVCAFAWFIYLNLLYRHIWVLWSIIAWRALILVVNFTVSPNINFSGITDLRRIEIWGELATVAIGKAGDWDFLIRISEAMLLLFIIDAAIKAWRRGLRSRALIFGTSLFAAILCAGTFSIMFTSGDLPGPMTVSMPFMCIILLMGIELGQDLVRSKKLSVELQKNKDYQEHILTSIADAVFSVKMPERILEWARDTYNVLGYDPEECIGKSTEIFYNSHEDYLNFGRLVEDSIRKGDKILVAEVDLCKKSGDIFPAEISLSFYCVDKELVSITGLVRDITARRNNENERMQLRQELAHYNRVMQLNELSINLAHEINQPLGAIMNNVSAGRIMIEKQKEGAGELSEILDDIGRDADRAAQIIRSVRSNIEQKNISFQKVNINDIIKNVSRLFQKSLHEKQITLHLHLMQDPAYIKADVISLQQVLVNLIANALEAMRHAPVKILRISSVKQSPDVIMVGVSDSGLGIDSIREEKMFSPFFSTKQGGLGMGLGICKTIIADHEGRIWFENNQDAGATFYFSLPAYKANPE